MEKKKKKKKKKRKIPFSPSNPTRHTHPSLVVLR